MAGAAEALARLSDPAFEVSCHYLIAEDGEVMALVPEERRAWHAGAGRWGSVSDVNSRSIGIELANRGSHPFAHRQMTALEALLGDVLARWRIPPERVIGHADMAPDRKSDPGPRFDWRRLARAGLSVWPEAGASEEGDLAADLAAFGYDPCQPPDSVLAAFRARFRPFARGPAGPGDRAAARDLAQRFPAERFPVDRGAARA